MIQIQDRKLYDTDAAEHCCKLTCDARSGDFGWHETDLYRTRNGAWFLAGRGNALSMWGRTIEGNMHPGEGIRVLDAEEALELLEAEGANGVIMKYFEVTDA